MVDLNQLTESMNMQVAAIQDKINSIFNFVLGRVKNFEEITIVEKIAYPLVALGAFLIFLSLILFVLGI